MQYFFGLFLTALLNRQKALLNRQKALLNLPDFGLKLVFIFGTFAKCAMRGPGIPKGPPFPEGHSARHFEKCAFQYFSSYFRAKISELCRIWAPKWPPFGKSTTPSSTLAIMSSLGSFWRFAGPSRGVFGGRSEVSKVYFGSKI